MTTLQTAAQQALAFTMRDFASLRDFEAAKAVLHDNLRAALAQQPEPVQEPVAKVELMTTGGNAGLATRIVEIDDHLRERLRPGQLLYTTPPQRQPQTIDEAMQQPRAMAQAYENGYKAGAAAERKRIIQFLTEMQRQVGDGHNYYGVAAMRIREMV